MYGGLYLGVLGCLSLFMRSRSPLPVIYLQARPARVKRCGRPYIITYKLLIYLRKKQNPLTLAFAGVAGLAGDKSSVVGDKSSVVRGQKFGS